jgi:hypothetical protein
LKFRLAAGGVYCAHSTAGVINISTANTRTPITLVIGSGTKGEGGNQASVVAWSTPMNPIRPDKHSPGRAMVDSDIRDGAGKASALADLLIPPTRQPHMPDATGAGRVAQIQPRSLDHGHVHPTSPIPWRGRHVR